MIDLPKYDRPKDLPLFSWDWSRGYSGTYEQCIKWLEANPWMANLPHAYCESNKMMFIGDVYSDKPKVEGT